jgi:hypothetical protein
MTDDETIRPYNDPHIGGMHLFIDGYEHIIMFNDYTSEGYLVFDPFLGLSASKFTLDFEKNTSITYRPNVGGYYLSEGQLVQNIENSVETMGMYYDTYQVNETSNYIDYARSLLGYQPPKYLDQLGMSSKSKFIFWRGMIQDKGSVNALTSFINAKDFVSVKVDEIWAYKIGEFGNVDNKQYYDINIQPKDIGKNELRLQFTTADNPVEQTFVEIATNDQVRWEHLPDQQQYVNSTTNLYFEADITNSTTIQVNNSLEVYEPGFNGPNIDVHIPNVGVVDGVMVVVHDTKDSVSSVLVPNEDYVRDNNDVLTILSDFDSQIGFDNDVYITTYLTTMNKSKYNPAFLIDKKTMSKLATIMLWHPAVGFHYQVPMSLIDSYQDLDNAVYNNTLLLNNVDAPNPLKAWSVAESGKIWLRTNSIDYVPYYNSTIFPDVRDRIRNWGRLADWSAFDVYQWTESPVPPAQWTQYVTQSVNNVQIAQNDKPTGIPLQNLLRRCTYVASDLTTQTTDWESLIYDPFIERNVYVDGNGVIIPSNSGQIQAVSVTFGGGGYETSPNIAISGGGGSGCVTTAQIGIVNPVPTGYPLSTTMKVINGGTGYSVSSPPSINIVGPTIGTVATATATVVQKTIKYVSNITLTNGGSNFSSGSTVQVTIESVDGNGSGAEAEVVLAPISTTTGLFIEDIVVSNGGDNYRYDEVKPIFVPNNNPNIPTLLAVGYAQVVSGGIFELEIHNSGSGYTVDGVFDVRLYSVDGSGYGAAGTVTISGGSVSDAQITNPGSGYSQNAIVELSSSYSGSATTTFSIVGVMKGSIGSVTLASDVGAINWYNPPLWDWTNKTVPLTMTTPSGSGTGALFSVELGNAGFTYVQSIKVTNGGSGFTSAPIITITDLTGKGAGASATAQVSQEITGVVDTITVTNVGSGYTIVPTVVIDSPPGYSPGSIAYSKASAIASISANNSSGVTGITLKSSGEGYTIAPSVVFENTGTGGIGAEAHAVLKFIETGRVDSIVVTNGGLGYTSVPEIKINDDGVFGAPAGNGATAVATLTQIPTGTVSSITINDGGTYLFEPNSLADTGSVAIDINSSGSGIGATATATLSDVKTMSNYIKTLSLGSGGNKYELEDVRNNLVQVLASDPNGGGVPALVGYGVMDSGGVTRVEVENPGSGLQDNTYSLDFFGSGYGASATAIVSGGRVVSVSVTNSGGGFIENPTAILTSSEASNLQSGVHLFTNYVEAPIFSVSTNFNITAVTIATAGTGLTDGDYHFDDGLGFVVVSGGVAVSATVTNPVIYNTNTKPTMTVSSLAGVTLNTFGYFSVASVDTTFFGKNLTDGRYPLEFTGGNGGGASAYINVYNGTVSGNPINSSAGSYDSVPSAQLNSTVLSDMNIITGNALPSFKVHIGGALTGVSLVTQNVGGWVTQPTLNVTSPRGTGATVNATFGNMIVKTISRVTITNGGLNYTTAPTIQFIPIGLTMQRPASGTAVIQSIMTGTISKISMISKGAGYYGKDNVYNGPVNMSISINNKNAINSTVVAAQAYPVLETTYEVDSIVIDKPGFDYSVSPTVSLVGGDGTGATIDTVTISSITNQSVVGMTIQSPGTNYVANPAVVITGGGGVGATAEATASINVYGFTLEFPTTLVDYKTGDSLAKNKELLVANKQTVNVYRNGFSVGSIPVWNIIDSTLVTPPTTPGVGDLYVVSQGGLGAWVGLDNHLVMWNGSKWYDYGNTTKTSSEGGSILYEHLPLADLSGEGYFSKIQNQATIIDPTNMNNYDNIRFVLPLFNQTTDQLTTNNVEYQFETPYTSVDYYNEPDTTRKTTKYYFWVKDKTNTSSSQPLSLLEIAEQLKSPSTPYMFMQGFQPTNTDTGAPARFTQVIIRGISDFITDENRYKIRFQHNPTLRDETDITANLTKKIMHTEWEMFRQNQTFAVSKFLWTKLTEAVVGYKVTDSSVVVPTLNRVLYDQMFGSATRIGLGEGQAFTDKSLSLNTIVQTIEDPKYDLSPVDKSLFLDTYSFDTPDEILKAMNYIYNTFAYSDINRIFFACLHDALSLKEQYGDIMKTSAIAIHSVNVLQTANQVTNG